MVRILNGMLIEKIKLLNYIIMTLAKTLNGALTAVVFTVVLANEGYKQAKKGGEKIIRKTMAQPAVQDGINWVKEKSDIALERSKQELEKYPTLKKYFNLTIEKGEVVLKIKDQKAAIAFLKEVEEEYNGVVQLIGQKSYELYEARKQSVQEINRFEIYLNSLSNSPIEFERVLRLVKADLREIHEAMKLEEENRSANIKGAGMGAAGVAGGTVVAVAGSTALMAAATAFGTASTGVAISGLSGAAATNAALAWLGDGTLATGGGGMSAGSALLGLAGPVGWSIAGVAAIGAGVITAKKNSESARKATSQAKELRAKAQILSEKCSELESLTQQTGNLRQKVAIACETLERIVTKDHNKFTYEQKSLLCSTVNDVRSLGQLINIHISIE